MVIVGAESRLSTRTALISRMHRRAQAQGSLVYVMLYVVDNMLALEFFACQRSEWACKGPLPAPNPIPSAVPSSGGRALVGGGGG